MDELRANIYWTTSGLFYRPPTGNSPHDTSNWGSEWLI